MGRGLSPLQQWILRRATEKPDRSKCAAAFGVPAGKAGCDLTIGRVLHEFYGVPVSGKAAADGDFLSGPTFRDRSAEARRHRPAVSRAFTRLAERGQVELVGAVYSRWSGINLIGNDDASSPVVPLAMVPDNPDGGVGPISGTVTPETALGP